MNSFYWHDYETFGVNPRRHRPAQFAGQRTDEELNPVGDPLVVYCQPVDDDLPEPAACLITGITPQLAQREGVPEPEFAALIHEQMATANTCSAGYNSIRFDDEVSRHLFYRNFFDPYAREWQNGNSRWDLIDVVRLCYALRPDGIEWPQREDGAPSFKLEHLSAANNLSHETAHDALSDVRATIALARLLRTHQPRLFDYCLGLRNKQRARGLLDFANLTPVLHASGKYRSERGGLAMVLPLCPHPVNRNGVIVYDLTTPPDDLLNLDAGQISDRIFTPSADLPDGAVRVPLKTVHINRAPVLSPVSALKNVDTARIDLDMEACQRHRQQIVDHQQGLADKVQSVFSTSFAGAAEQDAEQALYAGLIDRADLALMPTLRSTTSAQIQTVASKLKDPRLIELAWRYRARFHSTELSAAEHQRWQQHRQRRLLSEIDGVPRLTAYRAWLEQLREEIHDPAQTGILDQLNAWADKLEGTL